MSTSPVQSVTSAPVSARDERAGRTRRYLVMMGIRTLCFVAAFVTDGWVRWTCVALAVLLPYVAVVLANIVRHPGAPLPQTVAVNHRRQLDAG